MTVLELSEFVKELEEIFGVSAAALLLFAAAPAAGGEAAAAEEKDELMLSPGFRWRQENQRYQGCSCTDRSGSERS